MRNFRLYLLMWRVAESLVCVRRSSRWQAFLKNSATVYSNLTAIKLWRGTVKRMICSVRICKVMEISVSKRSIKLMLNSTWIPLSIFLPHMVSHFGSLGPGHRAPVPKWEKNLVYSFPQAMCEARLPKRWCGRRMLRTIWSVHREWEAEKWHQLRSKVSSAKIPISWRLIGENIHKRKHTYLPADYLCCTVVYDSGIWSEVWWLWSLQPLVTSTTAPSNCQPHLGTTRPWRDYTGSSHRAVDMLMLALVYAFRRGPDCGHRGRTVVQLRRLLMEMPQSIFPIHACG